MEFMQSDVMVVMINSNDYYVSEKVKGLKPFYGLLLSRSEKSPHYKTLSDAYVAADALRDKIIKKFPDCEIVLVQIKEYAENEAVYDSDGEFAFQYKIKEDGSKKIIFKEIPEEYSLIEKQLYQFVIQNHIDEIRNDEEYKDCNYRLLGLENGYIVSKSSSLSHLYFERYKAKELIRTFLDDKELFGLDIEYYNAYIEAINRSIDIQKKYVLKKKAWNIYVFVEQGALSPDLDYHVSHSKIGSYNLFILNDYDDFSKINDNLSVLVLYLDKKNKDYKIIEKLQEYNVQQYVLKLQKPSRRLIMNSSIEGAVSSLFKLGKCEDGNTIDSAFIPALKGFSKVTDEDDEDD